MTFHASIPAAQRRAMLQPAFANPVQESQRFFRVALEALSRPGHVVHADCAHGSPGHPAPLHPATAGLCLTLVDGGTPVCLDGASDADRDGVAGWLRFHCGCRIVDDPAAAAFAIITDPDHMPRLKRFCQGTLRDPHLAATLLIQVDALAGEQVAESNFMDAISKTNSLNDMSNKLDTTSDSDIVTLAGPGVDGSIRFAARGLPDWFWNDMAAQRTSYPQGVDIFLTAGATMAGLPRSVRLPDHGGAPCT